MRRFLLAFMFIAVLAPLALGAGWQAHKGWPGRWGEADWSSSGIAPSPDAEPRAMVQVYSARAGRWKSIFASHSWIVVKPANARRFTRYDVVGWGRPVRVDAWVVDSTWYSNRPRVIYDLRGPQAARLIPRIKAAIDRYPYGQPGDYRTWPGPNSNSFIAWLGRQLPEFRLHLPPTAIGKDFTARVLALMPTPSNTGWQVSLGGLIGLGASLEEGLELHLAGATIGVDFMSPALKLPSIGRVGTSDILPGPASAAPPAPERRTNKP